VRLRLAQRDLAAAAKSAARQVPARPLPPILAGVLLEAADDQLSVSGFDFEASATAIVPADVLEPGRIVVPGKLLADIAGVLPTGDVDLFLNGGEAVFERGDARFTLALLPVGEYPTLPVMPPASGTVPGDLLASAVVHAAGATAELKDSTGTLSGMAGVNLAVEDGYLVVRATDRYTVVEHHLPWDGEQADAVTVSPRILADAARATAGGDVHLSLGGTLLGAAGVGSSAVVRTFADPFPARISEVWPKELAATLEIDAGQLLAAVRRIALVAEGSTPLLIEATADSLVLQAANGSAARGRERIDAVLEGPESFRVAFQPRRLMTALAPLSGLLQVGLTTPTRPAVFRSADDPDRYRCLVMPVRHDWVTATRPPARAAA
jgi:DNA polymerase-3 subunit beta